MMMPNKSSLWWMTQVSNAAQKTLWGAFLTLAACGAASTEAVISTFGLDKDSITQGQTVKVTAILSDSQQGGSMAGFRGVLLDPSGSVYGTFGSSDLPGTFTYDISWEQLHANRPIGFATEDVRTFVAEFVDDLGHKVSRTFSLRLHCNGRPACEGQCTTNGANCPLSKGLQCLAGQCGTGCVVDNTVVPDGKPNPANPCEVCDVTKSKLAFSPVPAFTACGTNLSCSYDSQCNVPFRIRQVESLVGLRTLHLASMRGGRTLALAGAVLTPTHRLAAATATDTFTSVSTDIKTRFKLDSSILYEGGRFVGYSLDGGQTFSSPPSSGMLTGTTAIWASSTTNVWVGSSSGVVYRSSDNLATVTQTAEIRGALMRQPIVSIAGTGPTDVYVVNDKGEIARTTDQGLTYSLFSVSSAVPNVLWARAPSDLYMGTNGGFYRYNAATKGWTLLTPPAGSTGGGPGRAIAACSANDIFFAGQNEIWHSTDGSTMKKLPTTGVGQAANWYAIDCIAPGRVIIGGNGGSDGQPLIIESF